MYYGRRNKNKLTGLLNGSATYLRKLKLGLNRLKRLRFRGWRPKPTFAFRYGTGVKMSEYKGKRGKWQRLRTSFGRYMPSMKWLRIPAAAGFTLICYQQYRHIRERERRKLLNNEAKDMVIPNWQATLLKQLPTRSLSRVWGVINDVTLPVWLRWIALNTYIWAFKCNMDEAKVEDVKSYENLGKFFSRHLKEGARVVDKEHDVVSPVDGRIICFGRVYDGKIEQIKGICYSLSTFFGPDPDIDKYCKVPLNEEIETKKSETGLKNNVSLYHCVIYLAPGDYHRFHSPTEWNIKYRRHFPGKLISVSPIALKFVRGLFACNERVNLVGNWQYGLFSMSAVGAYNVGSIKLDFDKALATNIPGKYKEGEFEDFNYTIDGIDNHVAQRGDSIGEFNFGSTIVLIFEAPTTFKFTAEHGQKVKYGQPIGTAAKN